MQENSQIKPKTDLKKKMTLIISGLFLFFVFLEIGLRLGGFILLSIQEHKNLRSIKQKGTYRVLCLGESTTAGQYPQFLEETLNRRNIGIKFSVIDKGIPLTSSYIIAHLEENLNKYMPDMVITMMGINDFSNLLFFGNPHTPKAKVVIFFRSFRTYKLFRLIWLHIVNKVQEIVLHKSKVAKVEIDKQSYKSALRYAYNEEDRCSQLEASFKKAIELNPKDYLAYISLGWIYINQGYYDQAEATFKKAIEINARKEDGYIGLGRVYKDNQRYSEIEDCFRKAVQLNPKNDSVYESFGTIFKEEGRYKEAKSMFDKTMQLNPYNGNAYFQLGWCYKMMGNYSEAEAAFKKSLEINPHNERVYGSLMILYEETGKHELMGKIDSVLSSLRLYYKPTTRKNYCQLVGALNQRGTKLVCVQYPMRSVESLKKMLEGQTGLIFVDNEKIFRECLKNAKYEDYFRDNFAGDFGHCTEKGNKLLAGNIANVILKEVFNK